MDKFLVKLLMNSIVAVPLLVWFSEAGFLEALLLSVGLSVFAYLFGDQMLLRTTNNIVATLADVVLAFVYFWGLAIAFDWTLTLSEIAVLSIGLGVVEFALHRLMQKDMGAGEGPIV